MSLYLAKFEAHSPFLDSLPRSDTLFGALCWGWRMLGYDIGEILDRFMVDQPDPPFLISSCFPYIEDQYLLPKPILSPINIQPACLEDIYRVNAYKSIQWVAMPIFQRFLSVNLDEQREIFEKYSPEKSYVKGGAENYIQVGTVLYERNIVDTVYSFAKGDEAVKWMSVQDELLPLLEGDLQRNVIDRVSGSAGDSLLFKDNEIDVNPLGGIYFLIQFRDKNYLSPLEEVLRFISMRGFGGAISVGKGDVRFVGELEEAQGFWNVDSPMQCFIVLSLYYARLEERQQFDLDGTWYRLIPRKGRVESGYITPKHPWKRTVMMYQEGSTFSFTTSDISRRGFYGEVPVVSTLEDNGLFEIRQYGYAFAVGRG